MNWIMRSTLRLAKHLKKRNKQLSEKIRELSIELKNRLQHPVIDADDFATLQKEIRNYTVIERCIIIAEGFFNFFAAKAIFNFPGWLAIAAQLFFSLVVTWVSIPLFRNLFFQIIHENSYKREQLEPRSWRKLVFFLIPGAIMYEFGMYNLCKLRGEQIEGGNSGFITTLMIIIGMLLPVIAGYFAYERRKYYSPYINTLKINNLQKCIARRENRIQANLQRMENHFKQRCQELWAIFNEFKTYKENYNRKHGFPEESLSGHFSETQATFISEAIERYTKEALLVEPVKPAIILPPAWNPPQNINLQELLN
jgi:predicted DNA-binding protein